MKFILTLAVSVLMCGVVFASSASSQEPATDFGEQSPFLAACSHLWALGENDGFVVKNCRRRAADEIDGNRALIQLRIATDRGPFEFSVEMRKSLWQAVAWK